MDSSFLYLDDIMLQYDEDVVNRDFEKIRKIENPRRSFNPHGYVNNNNANNDNNSVRPVALSST